jgi:transcriptional regulator with XRE-family HTH domain
MGLHRPTISEIEAGRRRVSADEIAQFAEIYGVGTDWILSERDSATSPDDDKILLAARQLSRMKDDDLDRLMKLIHMLKKPKVK